MPLMLFSIPIGATLEGKNMLPMGSILFPFIVAPLRCGLLYIETYSTIPILGFDNTDLLLNYVTEFKLYFAFSYFGNFCFYHQ